MSFIDTDGSNSNSFQHGSKLYVILLTIVATLGGLLFGYDTAVVNGAEKSLVEFYIYKTSGNSYIFDLNTVTQLFTQYRIMMVIVLYLVFIVLSGQFIRLFGKKRGGIITAVILGGLTIWAVRFITNALPDFNDIEAMKNMADAVKGFVISSALIGCIIGGAAAGFVSKSLGRKNGLFIAGIAFFISAIGAWKPEQFNVFGTLDVYSFVFYRIICGLGVGLASMISPMYIAEIAPANVRGKLVSFNQFAIILGMLVIHIINLKISRLGDDQWLLTEGWRLMFLSAVIPSGIFILILIFIPETPRYLAMKGNDKKALSVLQKLSGNSEAHHILKDIKGTLHEPNAPWLSYGVGVIIIGVLLSVFQQAVGINAVLYYAGNIFRNNGATTDSSLFQTIIVAIVNLAFTVLAIMTVDKFGRKPLMIIGSIGMAVSMLGLGFTFYYGHLGLFALIFILTYIAAFAMSWGPVCWVLLSEIFPNSIRGALSIAVAAQWIANWIVSFTFPMLNDNVWLTNTFHHGFAYWIYGIMCILSALFMWKFVPETKGKTLESIEKLWIKK